MLSSTPVVCLTMQRNDTEQSAAGQPHQRTNERGRTHNHRALTSSHVITVTRLCREYIMHLDYLFRFNINGPSLVTHRRPRRRGNALWTRATLRARPLTTSLTDWLTYRQTQRRTTQVSRPFPPCENKQIYQNWQLATSGAYSSGAKTPPYRLSRVHILYAADVLNKITQRQHPLVSCGYR